MTLAIHNSKNGFHPRWIAYCKSNDISFKLVDCYCNDIINELKDCDALLWHHSHSNSKDILIAKQILFALEHSGFKVFPDFRSSWHFDDKLAQKYLLQQIGAPLVPTYSFFNQKEAIQWVKNSSFPKVFKLRGGAGSQNVKLVESKKAALKLIKKSFASGFSSYDKVGNLKERWRKYRNGNETVKNLFKGIVRILYPPRHAEILGRQKGYIYFQDFIPNNNFDIRIIVIGDRAFALKRFVRQNDFRASGSGNFSHEKKDINMKTISTAFEVNEKIKSQCAVFDFVFDTDGSPLIIELSYGFLATGYDECPGYWDKNLNWHEGKFNPQGWIIEDLLDSVKTKG